MHIQLFLNRMGSAAWPFPFDADDRFFSFIRLPFHRQPKRDSTGVERRSDFISCSYLSLNCHWRSSGSFSFIQHYVTFDVHCVVKHDSTRLDVFTLRLYLSLPPSVRSLFFFFFFFLPCRLNLHFSEVYLYGLGHHLVSKENDSVEIPLLSDRSACPEGKRERERDGSLSFQERPLTSRRTVLFNLVERRNVIFWFHHHRGERGRERKWVGFHLLR